jgi:hypothetical protein
MEVVFRLPLDNRPDKAQYIILDKVGYRRISDHVCDRTRHVLMLAVVNLCIYKTIDNCCSTAHSYNIKIVNCGQISMKGNH